MSDNKNISYTAADIERYHKGLMDARERNALEKAALDDPFLADALEGYAVPGVNAESDIPELKARLAKRLEKDPKTATLIPRNRFYFLRVAAIFILLAGAGWFIYQLSSGNNKKEIAYNPNNKVDTAAPTDSTITDSTVTTIITPNAGEVNNGFYQVQKETTKTANGRAGLVAPGKTAQQDTFPALTENKVPGIETKRADDEAKTKDLAMDRAANEDRKKAEAKESADEKAVVIADGMKRREAVTAPVARGAYDQPDQRSNNFRGQVRGINNENIPFANVTILNNNSSTYTDANGQFAINSRDSVLDVQVSSVGYETNRALLRNNANTDIILKNDKNQVSEVVVTAMGVKKEDDGEDKIKYDAEPADGWDKYNAYLKNNIRIPANFTAPAGKNYVEITFVVGKKGKPSSLSVETSLNKTCDREAIRLLKEGPSWKKGNGRIRIYF